MNADPERLAAGQRLLDAADWAGAQTVFEASLAEAETAEALTGLGCAVFWTGDMARALALRERAYVAYRDRQDALGAARTALWLAAEHGVAGNVAVSSGWLGRAERLIGELGDCAERGWLLLRRSREAADPAMAERLAREALEVGRACNDRDLEIAAISRLGRALLAAGRVEEGFRALDEAMAAATSGEVRDASTVGDTCCDMIVACERTAETERAMQWCRVTDEYARRYNFLPLFAFCRVTYASVLLALGRWEEAEREIHQALRSYRASFGFLAHGAEAMLAELRLLQGRDAEAEELLAPHLHNPACARVVAMLHLARGDAEAAVRVLRGRIAAVEGDVLLCVPLSALLVDALLAAGDVAGAGEASGRLQTLAAQTGRPALAAMADLATARVACANGEVSAVARFEAAIAGFTAAGVPLPAARARLGLAHCLLGEDARAARAACTAAVAALEELGAKRDLDAAAELRRRLGVGARVGPRVTGKLTRREEEVLSLLALGLSNPEIGRRLYISPKTVEHHTGQILRKLDLKTRAAAAAYAAKTRRVSTAK